VPGGKQRVCPLLWWFGMARRHAKDHRNIAFNFFLQYFLTLLKKKKSTNQLTATTKNYS